MELLKELTDPKVLKGVALGVGATWALQKLMAQTPPKPAAKVELHYWNGRGLMEIARMCLAYAGQFPGDYADSRYTTDSPSRSVKAMAEIGDKCGANLGRLPLCTVGDESIGQSAAIFFFVGSELGLMGSSNLETAKVLEIQAHLSEMKDAMRTIMPYGETPTEAQLKTWFSGGATDASPSRADIANRTRYFKWFAGRIEYRIGSGGFAVGGTRTLADMLIYNTFAEVLQDFEAKPGVAQYKREPFGSKAMTDAALESCPNLRAVCSSVAAEPNLVKWFKVRSTPPEGKNLQAF